MIGARTDHNKEHMGLKSWKHTPDGKIVKTDVSIAKNYLEKDELAELNEIVTMYLDYATRQARRRIPMTMEDWKTKLDAFLRFNDAEVLHDKGKVTAAIAKEFAEDVEIVNEDSICLLVILELYSTIVPMKFPQELIFSDFVRYNLYN